MLCSKQDHYPKVFMKQEKSMSTKKITAEIATLVAAFQAKEQREFGQLAKAIDWAIYDPATILEAVYMAVNLGHSRLTKDLARKAFTLFPENQQVRRVLDLFDPLVPSRIVPIISPTKGLNKTRFWLDNHAAEYRGKWLAVNQGILVAATETYPELQQFLAQIADRSSTVVMRV
jgi:hypothetical protein